MKIAIYGDSFASGFPMNKHFAWYNLLAEKLGGKVFDHKDEEGFGIAWGGRATYLSYKNFLKYYKNYDFNIFIAGDPYRHTKEYTLKINAPFYISNYNTVEPSFESGIIDRKEADYLTGWFMMSDHEYLIDMQELILRDIESKDSKCLMIPSQRQTSFIKERMNKLNMDFGLTDLHGVQLKSMKSPPGYWAKSEPPDKISCHYSVETNQWLANAVYDYLTNNKKLELPEYIPHEYDYRYYYEEQ